MNSEKRVIAFVGAGGKTSAMYACAAKYAAAGKKVLIMTTTKMGLPGKRELLVTRPDPDGVSRVLDQYGICVSGKSFQDGGVEKIGSWTETVMLRLSGEADLVLLEADGAKRKSLKVPAGYEPVIPDWCTHLVILMGLSKLACSCGEEVHRCRLMFDARERITPDTYVRILEEGYGTKLRQAGEEALWKQKGNVWFLLNQADDKAAYYAGMEIFSKLEQILEVPYKTGILSLHRHKVWMLEE